MMKLESILQAAPYRLLGRLSLAWLLAGTIVLAGWVGSARADLTVLAEGDECHPVEIPNEDDWGMSGHADVEAEAFTHWDEDDPPEVPTRCAKCHSTPGHLDFLGSDGSEAGVVDIPAPIGTTIECMACHNEVSAVKDSVVMPSGVELTALGSEARCMECHQGRESSVSVDAYIADAGVVDDDTVSENLSFRNIHYYPAAATLYGATALGAYQYEGKSYDVKFAHVSGVDACIDCHDPHSLEVRIDTCAVCHDEVIDRESLREIRMAGSAHDYDGDGRTAEGISGEFTGLQEALYAAIQAYASTTAGTPIAYDFYSYPYFFVDDDDGMVGPDESTRYNAWTARLLKAAYNYQASIKDPGAFAHNAKYMIQLLHNSIEDLDVDAVAGLSRNDVGHLAGSDEQWRHWDEDGEVSASCAKCHSATGLPFLLDEGAIIAQPLSNGLMCETCHDAIPRFARRQVAEVEFPSGAVLDTGDEDSNVCINCHQGRESGLTIQEATAGLDPDTAAESLRFSNPHYFAAGATLFGTQAKGTYEYEGKTYEGRLSHIGRFNVCTECHDAHALEVDIKPCSTPFCHGGITTAQDIRKDRRDFDGDCWTTEGLARETETFQDVLYGTILDYAADVVNAPIIYDAHSYPYFFNDSNGNGEVDEGEATRSNGFASWTPRLLRAAYNYQYAQKDPGAFAHNGHYMIQVLYDSLEDMATQVPVDMSSMIRP
ncbi:MAG: hypothetical protein JSW27_07980 [Phycisphaerales bacterium]|nr:MAG: hypothetical protein JSW27_07980 [Phycisphaerales bacterium]